MKKYLILTVVVGLAQAIPEPPAQQGWGQQQQAPQAQAWGQQQFDQSQQYGVPQAPQQQYGVPQAQAQGWGQQQQQAPQAQGWGQQQNSGGHGGKGGKKGVDWEYNFALGYQGDKGWGAAAAPAPMENSGGWSSEPETNIKKPSLSGIFSAIIGFPKEIYNLLKDSGLWILFVPLLVIVPLFIFAYSAGKFFGGMDEGWGWDKRSGGSKKWYETEWDNLKGFIKDPRVQKAAKGFMDEFVASRIVTSVSSESVVSPVKKISKRR